MAAYSLDTLLQRWALHQLTSEQAIGQILQVLHDLEPRVKRLEQAVPFASKPPTPPPAPNTPPKSSSRKQKR